MVGNDLVDTVQRRERPHDPSVGEEMRVGLEVAVVIEPTVTSHEVLDVSAIIHRPDTNRDLPTGPTTRPRDTTGPRRLAGVSEDRANVLVGQNAWLVDEMYEQYRANPNSVSA